VTTPATDADRATAERAKRAVSVVFALNGFCFAGLVARFPDVRGDLDLGNGAFGLLLLAIAAGSVIALPSSGWLIQRSSAAAVVRLGGVLVLTGLVVGALGASVVGSVVLAAAGLFTYGVGTSVWDVAMNVEGAAVEQRLGRTIMPRFHAGWSLGTITGAGIGVLITALSVPVLAHLTVVGVLGLVLLLTVGVPAFLPAEPEPETPVAGRSAWLEPRTLAIGLMVLAFAAAEGSANDWLTLALIDGHDVEHWVGVLGYAVFVTAMPTGRMAGPPLLDRYGRAPVLWVTTAAAAGGILLVVLGGHWVVIGLGIVVWGLGASLGFPVGMSAAADDPTRAAARVSVVSTLGYSAFLAGPPLLGQLADRVGTLDALLAIAILMGPAAVSVLAARPPRERSAG
jgi:MFS family permease